MTTFTSMYLLVRDRRRYDVVLVFGFNMLPLAAVIAGRLTGKRCVVRPESPMEPEVCDRGGKPGKDGIARDFTVAERLRLDSPLGRPTRGSTSIAISSRFAQGLGEAGVDPAKITSIPNGIDVGKFGTPGRGDRAAAGRRARGAAAPGRR